MRKKTTEKEFSMPTERQEFSTLLLNWQYDSLECTFKKSGYTSWYYPVQMALVLC